MNGEGSAAELAEDGKVLVRIAEDQNPSHIFQRARQWGFQVRDVVPVRQRLEDVFLEAVAGGTQVE